jgi:hypothetical protein
MPARFPLLLLTAGLLLMAGCDTRHANPVRSGVGLTSHTLCAGVFISGQDAEQIFAEALAPFPGFGLLKIGLRYQVDPALREVRASFLGLFASRAVYQKGRGCTIVTGTPPEDLPEAPAGAQPIPAAAPGPESVMEPRDPALKAALDDAFAEPEAKAKRQTKAVVILRHGRVIAERYAPGYGVNTPVPGWSAAKSVTSALVGILVREGKLALQQPAPVAEWQRPDDPRRAITVDMLLRHTAGLALTKNGNDIDVTSRMLFAEPDMAAFAASAPLDTAPGTGWAYMSGNYLILSRIVRDAVGGRPADVVRFAERELFQPLGIHTAVLEFDEAGTAVGSSYLFASARDWARFAQLYLRDGVAHGRRILPAGWVDYSTAPVPSSPRGYGAGWWTNRGTSEGARHRVELGMPPDSFYASGFLGQYVVVVPSEDLVVARFGITQILFVSDLQGMGRLVAQAAAAVHGKP